VKKIWIAGPIINGKLKEGKLKALLSSIDHHVIGKFSEASIEQVKETLCAASKAKISIFKITFRYTSVKVGEPDAILENIRRIQYAINEFIVWIKEMKYPASPLIISWTFKNYTQNINNKIIFLIRTKTINELYFEYFPSSHQGWSRSA
jgi:hypothetical protein